VSTFCAPCAEATWVASEECAPQLLFGGHPLEPNHFDSGTLKGFGFLRIGEEIAGYGSKADYDGSLNDRAIGAAVSDVLGSLVNKLEERPWRTDVLKVEGRTVYISGGARQGLKPGDIMAVMQEGEKVVSAQRE
jgi:hypothetical protein